MSGKRLKCIHHYEEYPGLRLSTSCLHSSLLLLPFPKTIEDLNMSVSLKTEAYFDMSFFELSVSKRAQLRSMSNGPPFKRSTDTRTCFSVSIRLRKS